MRFITKTMHAYIDYPVAILLLAAPFILGLGTSNPLAMWLSVAIGAAAFVLTLLTDHATGVFKVLPYNFHLTVDGLVGALFVVAPIVLGFKGLDLAYYVVLGVTVLLVVGLHKPEPTLQPA